jgi:hypothetical protein
MERMWKEVVYITVSVDPWKNEGKNLSQESRSLDEVSNPEEEILYSLHSMHLF